MPLRVRLQIASKSGDLEGLLALLRDDTVSHEIARSEQVIELLRSVIEHCDAHQLGIVVEAVIPRCKSVSADHARQLTLRAL